LHTPGSIDLLTCIHMHLFEALDKGQLCLSHYGYILFGLLNRELTTITRPSNLIYDNDVDGEFESGSNAGHDDDEGDDDPPEAP